MQIKKSNYFGGKNGDASTLIEIKTRTDEIDVYYSYTTIIAFRINGKLFISKNEWTKTTGKHLNAIYRDKSVRIPHEKLMTKLEYLYIGYKGPTFDIEIEKK